MEFLVTSEVVLLLRDWDGLTNFVSSNPERSICYFFFPDFFGFYEKILAFIILILKQKSVLRRSKQAVNSVKKFGIRENKIHETI